MSKQISLVPRLRELSDEVAAGRDAIHREFTRQIPADPDRDAEFVLSVAAERIEKLEAAEARMRDCLLAIKRHVEPLNSALATSILATCNAGLGEQRKILGNPEILSGGGA